MPLRRALAMLGPMTLIERLGCKFPIIQAPMAGTSTSTMAAAVTRAGGLGSIGVAAVDAASAGAMIDEVRALTTGPFNVNVFVHRPQARDEAAERAWAVAQAPLFAEFGEKTDPVPPGYPMTYDAGKALIAAAKATGEGRFGAQWAGQGAPLSRPMPAGELVEVLAREAGL